MAKFEYLERLAGRPDNYGDPTADASSRYHLEQGSLCFVVHKMTIPQYPDRWVDRTMCY